MTCEDARRSIPLMEYGEISFDQEELVHAHLEQCAECRAEVEREKALHSLLDDRELDVSPFQLRKSRDQLAAAIQAEQQHSRLFAWWVDVKNAFGATAWFPTVARPAGALALIALGFFGARFTPLGTGAGMQTAGVFDPSNARVRYVEPGQRGEIQLVVDETRQRVISGRIDDSEIRALLLAAAKDPSDPGVRVESVDVLKSHTGADDVRTALVYALQHDSNAGVRLQALEGLKAYAGEPDVRKALSQVLLTDDNPGLRTQAIDLLTQNSNEQHVIGVLQELMRRNEDNGYVRLRCEKALHAMKASIDTY
jgi:hypothetical protein